MVTAAHVRAAAARLHGAIEVTPTHRSRTLSQIAGCELYLKRDAAHADDIRATLTGAGIALRSASLQSAAK